MRLMNGNRKASLGLVASALHTQARSGRPSLTLSTRPFCNGLDSPKPLNKSLRLKPRPMDEAAKTEIIKRTGSSPFVEVKYV